MKSIVMLGAAVAAIAVMASNDRLAGVPGDTVATASVTNESYLLQFAGFDTSCTIRRADASAAGDTRLVIGESCPDTLAGVSHWRDNADGSVSFVSTDGQTVLDFAQGDGAAYETFRTGSPLATLVAAD